MNKLDKNETLFALHRYFLWANRMKAQFEEARNLAIAAPPNHQENTGAVSTHTFMYFCYWMASLYVVAEDWEKYGPKSTKVSKLLKSDHLKTIKRLRNGVFHFQKKYYDVRFAEFLEKGKDIIQWALELHSAIDSSFLVWMEEIGLEFNFEKGTGNEEILRISRKQT